jgi:hypothetical protein
MIENYFERYELFIEFMFIQLFPNYLKLFIFIDYFFGLEFHKL